MSRQARVTPEQYFEAALRILAADGGAELKIGRLCAEVGVTSGAFYHHFGGWPGFVTELLAYWEAEQTSRVLELTRARPHAWERVEVMKHLSATVPHEAEAAIRAWSRGEPAVAEAQQRVDRLREDGLYSVIAGVGVPERDARRLALMGVALLAGLQQLRSPMDTEELLGVLDELERGIVAHARIPRP
jgi:AcrR family transcriptional regulator